jgi:CHASE2 domain-containing sensor protein
MFPVLLDDAPALQPAELPAPLRPLAALQAARIRHDAFESGLEDLVARLTGRRLRDEADAALAQLRLERAKRWAVPAIALAVVLLAVMRLFDLLTLDTRLATWTLAVADAIAPVAFDASLVPLAIEAQGDARDPAMRARYADAIDALARAGAKRIVLDLHFHEPRPADAALAQAMQAARSRGAEVFFSFVDTTGGKPRAVAQLAAAANGVGLACVGRRLGYAQTGVAAFDVRGAGPDARASPLPSLPMAAAFGNVHVDAIDLNDRIVHFEAAGKATPVRYSVISNPIAAMQGCPAMTSGTRTAELLIRMVPAAALRARRIALADLLAGRTGPERLAGKTVIAGFETAEESFRIAQGLARTTLFGYELHVNAANTLIQGRVAAFTPPVAQAAIAALFASLGAFFGVRLRAAGGRRLAALLVTAALLYFGVAVALAATADLLLNSAYDVSAFAIAFLLFRRMARRWLK